MKIVVNGRFLSRQVTGVERYGREIMRHLNLESNCQVMAPKGLARRGVRGHAWEQLVLPTLCRSDEILWSPANSGPLAVSRQVLTLHDLSPLEHPEWYARSFSSWYRLFVPLLVRRVRRVVVSSEDQRNRMMRRFSLLPDKVSVVPGGVDVQRFRPIVDRPVGLPERYVLFVGSLQPRKNLGGLLQAWRQIQSSYPQVRLLLAGGTDSLFRPENGAGSQEGVVRLGYFPEADLPGLYAGADVLVLPSFDEGFGLPLLEAMACGTAVIAAESGVLRETAGEAAVYFNPRCPGELAAWLDCLLSDGRLCRSMADKGLAHVQSFTWSRSAGLLREVFEKCQ